MGLIKQLVMPMVGQMFSGLMGGSPIGQLGSKLLSGGVGSMNPLRGVMGGGGGSAPSPAGMTATGKVGNDAKSQVQFKPLQLGLDHQREQFEDQRTQANMQQPMMPQQQQPQGMPQQPMMPLSQAVFPTLTRQITSGFGNRQAPAPGASTFHQGIDLGGQAGSQLRAALSGKILDVGRNAGMGNYMKMLADNGNTLTYGHANAFNVRPGQQVTAGQPVGNMGSTGISTGNHLHFMSSRDGKYFDPMELFRQQTGGQ